MHLNADTLHVIEALEYGMEESEEGQLTVWDLDVVMRGISDAEMDERNIQHTHAHDNVCTIEWERSPYITLKFHENEVENEFSLNPVGKGAIDPQQATQPQELGSRLRDVVQQLNYAYDIHCWDFGKVNGASIATGGYVTDYEFEFEAPIK
jgi:hypothetical protein